MNPAARARRRSSAASEQTPIGRRSRAGCLTCKEKHVKCDETKPSCHKCAEKGWICRGYAKDVRWSYKHQLKPNAMATERRSLASTDQGRSRPSPTGQDFASQLVAPDAGDVTTGFPQDDILAPSSMVGSDSLDGFIGPDTIDDAYSALVAGGQELDGWGLTDNQVAIGEPFMALPGYSSSYPNRSSLLRTDLVQYVSRSPSGDGPDPALRLINNWFKEVCPAWSGFDSDMNMNRKLASDMWHSSAAVFKSLQSMSASFLSARIPEMRQVAFNLLKTATVCVQAEVNTINQRPKLEAMPTGILFSLICLGTSICWLDPSRVGSPFLKEAKGWLWRTIEHCPPKDSEQISTLQFFNKSLLYWEMLLSVVDDTVWWYESDAATLLSGSPQYLTEMGFEHVTDVRPHPWTGISSETSRLFHQSMRLCRNYRRRITKPTGRAISLSAALQEIDQAKRVEEQLLELDFSVMAPINETGDWKTPRIHLVHVAEAYQLAALLQLYVTFPDLVSLRLPDENDSDGTGHVPWDKWIIPLTLRLTRVLDQIPDESGSRVMQPLLCICASTGLRYDFSTPPTNGSIQTYLASEGEGLSSINTSEFVNQVADEGVIGAEISSSAQLALDIANARNDILRRLKGLRQALPPTPIIVAEELVKAIWVAYDEEPPGSGAVHWLDVMEKKDLRSLFG